MKTCAYFFAISLSLFFSTCKTSKEAAAKMPLVYEQNFDNSVALSQFEFTDQSSWKYHDSGALECTGQGIYKPAVRSPFSFALISGKTFGSFTLEAKLQQTGRVYDHQDMVLVFGFQNPSQFYYTHISKKMDDLANQIMIVNEKPRVKISTKTNEGQNWLNGKWHRIRLVRNVESGTIKLFFDNMESSVMEALDSTFGMGMIGFGSFDDSGMIDDIRIWSDKVSPTDKVYFQKKD